MNEEQIRLDELLSVSDLEREGRKRLSPDVINYIYHGAESEATLRRNVEAYSRILLRRRVLQGIEKVDTSASYFGGRIKSSLPFFPGCINVSPMYGNALLDILRVSESFPVPIFISHLSIVEPLEVSKVPSLVPKTSPLIWQIYLQEHNYELCFKQAKQAADWGYLGLAITVDAEQNVKLENRIPKQLVAQRFSNVTTKDLKRLRECTNLPLTVKGVMTAEDAELAVENGADGVIVSNHGGRILDFGQASVEVLPEIAKYLKSKKRTRNAEIFIDGGIRRGTDILKALALGARGCLLGRAIFFGLAVDHQQGAEHAMKILQQELVRAAAVCGVKRLDDVDPDIIRTA